MANEHYENANTRTEEQHAQQMDKSKAKPRDMLEAWTRSMDIARATLTRAFKEIRNEHPEYDIGSALRRFHLSLLDAIKHKPLESFNIVFGLLGLAISDSLTDEDKKALRNDSLDID